MCIYILAIFMFSQVLRYNKYHQDFEKFKENMEFCPSCVKNLEISLKKTFKF